MSSLPSLQSLVFQVRETLAHPRRRTNLQQGTICLEITAETVIDIIQTFPVLMQLNLIRNNISKAKCPTEKLENLLHRLSTLHFEDFPLTDIGTFGRLLQQNSSLTDLTLKHYLINPDTLQEICQGLQNNSTLRSLDLSNNRPYVESIFEDTFDTDTEDCRLWGATIGELLAVNQSLTSLKLSHNQLGRGIIELCNQLPNNHTLTSLDLLGNEIDITVLLTFAEAMRVNQTLQKVNYCSGLFDNNFEFMSDVSEEKTEQLFALLEENYSLLSFDLERGTNRSFGVKRNAFLKRNALALQNRRFKQTKVATVERK